MKDCGRTFIGTTILEKVASLPAHAGASAEDTFNISAAAGGAAINTSNSQSGTHKLWTKD